MLRFRLHPSRSRRFCKIPLPSFKVVPVLNVASLGVSVLPLHASLSACNRDMPLVRSSVQTAERGHSQPHVEVLSEQSFHGDFHARLPLRVVSCLNSYNCGEYRGFAIHPLPESMGLSCSRDCKGISFSLPLRVGQNSRIFLLSVLHPTTLVIDRSIYFSVALLIVLLGNTEGRIVCAIKRFAIWIYGNILWLNFVYNFWNLLLFG